MALALVRDLREHRLPASAEELAGFETDVLAGFVLARASAGLADSTIRNDTGHLELIRDWFGRPLREMQPADADAYFGKVLRDARPSTRTGRAAAVTVYFQFLELRHKVEIYNLTGRVAECPLDEMNRPRASAGPQLRVPPAEEEIEQLFAGWRGELATCRKFAPAARNYAAARLEADVGLRVNEACLLDLDDVRWELGRFGKLNVRHGKGSRRREPKPRLVPLINGADRNLRWFIEDVRGQFDADHARPGTPLFPSERKCRDGSCARATADVFRRSLAEAAVRHQLQRRLAERGMVISTGKMSGLWSGQPNTVRLDELDVICAVLGCGVEELLLPEPETVPQPQPAGGAQAAAVAEARPVTPRPPGGRSLPPR